MTIAAMPIVTITRCLLSGSCPQLLDVTLRAPQHSVDQKSVGVGRYLRRDPGNQPDERGGQSLAQPEDPLEARKGDLYVLPHSTPPLGAFDRQKDANLDQGLSQFPAAVGQVPQEPPRYSIPQSRLVDEFFGKGDVRDFGCCELVGERHPVGSTQQVQLHAVDAEGAPPYPRSSRKAGRLPNLARMQNFQQRRVYEQGFRLAYQLGEDLPQIGRAHA